MEPTSIAPKGLLPIRHAHVGMVDHSVLTSQSVLFVVLVVLDYFTANLLIDVSMKDGNGAQAHKDT